MICIVVLWECECVQKRGTKSGPPPTSSVVGIAVLLTDIVWHPNHIWLTDLDYWASGLLSFSQTPDVAGGGRFFSEVPSTIHHWTFGCAQGFQRPSNFVSTNDHKWWEGSPKMWLFWWGRILFQSRVWNVHSVFISDISGNAWFWTFLLEQHVASMDFKLGSLPDCSRKGLRSNLRSPRQRMSHKFLWCLDTFQCHSPSACVTFVSHLAYRNHLLESKPIE